jgi:hypothetical protein
MFAFLICPICTAGLVHLMLVLIALIKLSEEYKVWNSSVCNFPHSSTHPFSDSAPSFQTTTIYVLAV